MNLKSRNVLITCCFFLASISEYILAVTDAEIEALEKQVEQQEIESKRKAEEEVKRKAEARRKAEAEARRLAEEKKRKAEEENRALELEKIRLEEARQAELDRQKQEEEAQQKAEEEKKQKYAQLIDEAEQAIADKDKNLAINKYNEALTLFPNDQVSISGIIKAEKLKDKICYDVLGWWKNDYVYTIEWKLNEDGTTSTNLAHPPTWDCINPGKRQIRLSWGEYSIIRVLTENGDCLCKVDASIEEITTCSIVGDACYVRKDHEVQNNSLGNKRDEVIKNPLVR